MRFLDLPDQFSHIQGSRFVVVPLPYDGGTSWMPGARHAPAAIIEASGQMELFDEETGCEGFRMGIHTLPLKEMPLEPEAALSRARAMIRPLLAEAKMPLAIGGDHSVAVGPILEAFQRFGPLDILQLDAHTDLRESYQGSRYSHACAMRRIWHCGNVIQAGIRSMSREEKEFLEGQGAPMPIFASRFHQDEDSAMKEVLARLTGRPLYITIDVDCLDPAEMPATGTPEPGGLSWGQVTRLLKAVIQKVRPVAADLVELSPLPGLHFPQYTAARLIYKIINYMAAEEGEA